MLIYKQYIFGIYLGERERETETPSFSSLQTNVFIALHSEAHSDGWGSSHHNYQEIIEKKLFKYSVCLFINSDA